MIYFRQEPSGSDYREKITFGRQNWRSQSKRQNLVWPEWNKKIGSRKERKLEQEKKLILKDIDKWITQVLRSWMQFVGVCGSHACGIKTYIELVLYVYIGTAVFKICIYKQNCLLEQLRNCLLPKLMSGEIGV